MNTKFLNSLLAAIAGMVIFTSCSKVNDAGKYIPKDAAFVLVANSESITKKLPWEELKNGEFLRQLSADSAMNEFNRQAMENPEVTGVDIKQNITMFVVKDSAGGYAAVEGNIKDAAKFKSYFTGSLKGATASTKNGVDFLVKEKMSLGWNKERFIVAYDLPQMNEKNALPPMGNIDDSTITIPNPPVLRNGIDLINTLFDLKQENSLAKNEKFGDLMEETGDIHFYFNAENFNVGSMGMGMISMLNIGKLTEGAIATGIANFEDGKIVLDMKSYSGKDLSDLWKKYKGSAFNTDMIKRSPIQKVAIAVGFNFKPAAVQELLRLTGMEGFANLGAKQFGFSVDDFVKANKGDLAITVGDFPDSIAMGRAQPNAVFAASIKDKAAFTKLVAAGNKAGMGAGPFGYAVNDNYFSLATTKSLADAYIAGTAKNNYNFLDDISGQPIGGYINLQYIISSMTKGETDSLSQQVTTLSLAMWDHAIFKGGNWADGGLNQHVEIILMDKKTNSLKQLNNYANKMGIISKVRQKNWDDYGTVPDTTIMTAPVPDTTVRM